MGAMTCDRRGCDNAMCDRHNDTHGYICNECFEELVRAYPAVSVRRFMATPKEETTGLCSTTSGCCVTTSRASSKRS